MVTEVDAITALVATVNVALVAPAATVTLAGVLATAVLLLESVTVAPPDGAARLKVTVPVDEFPPVTLVGLRVSEERVARGGATAATGGEDQLGPPLEVPEMTAAGAVAAGVGTEEVAWVGAAAAIVKRGGL